MRVVLSLAFFSCFMLAGNAAQEDLAKKELDSLQGAWRCISWVIDGKEQPEGVVKGVKVTFKEKNASFLARGFAPDDVITIKIDPTKQPKTIDLVTTKGKGKSETALGIYSIEGDTLKVFWCNVVGGDKRPTEFKTALDDDVTAMVLKREKR